MCTEEGITNPHRSSYVISKTEEDERQLPSDAVMVELNDLADQNISSHNMENMIKAQKVYKLLPTNQIKQPRTKPGTRADLRSSELYNSK